MAPRWWVKDDDLQLSLVCPLQGVSRGFAPLLLILRSFRCVEVLMIETFREGAESLIDS